MPGFKEEVEVVEPGLGAMARLGSIWLSPGEVFADIGRRPGWAWALPLVLIIFAAVGAQIVSIPHIDHEATIVEQMDRFGQELPEEQLDRMVAQSESGAYINAAFVIVVFPVGLSLLTVLLWLGLKLLGSALGFGATFSLVSWAYMPPTLVGTILYGVLVQRAGKLSGFELQGVVKSNLGAFITEPAWLGSAMSSVDVFNAWIIALLALGFRFLARVSSPAAATLATAPFVIWIVLKVAGHLLLAAMTKS